MQHKAVWPDGRGAAHIHEVSDSTFDALVPATRDCACVWMQPMTDVKFGARPRMFAQEDRGVETRRQANTHTHTRPNNISNVYSKWVF